MKKKERKSKKILINMLLISTIIGIMIWLAVQEYMDYHPKESTNFYGGQVLSTSRDSNILKEQENETKTTFQETKQYPKEQLVESYQGYPVIAKLEIPAISLQTYVLKQYSTQALNVSVTKFWGADPNQIGNFCIAGHNFRNKNMFYLLKNLKMKDEIFIIENQVGKVRYEIYAIDTVSPDDVSCLSTQTNGKKEVTLITCTNDSKKRIIVKAIEASY